MTCWLILNTIRNTNSNLLVKLMIMKYFFINKLSIELLFTLKIKYLGVKIQTVYALQEGMWLINI